MMSSQLDLQKDHEFLQKVDFLKEAWRFVPKHLISIRNHQRKGGVQGLQRKFKDKDATYQQTTLQTINKNKSLYLAPVRDLQKIMRHFKRKFEGIQVKDQTNHTISKKGKKKACSTRLRTSTQGIEKNPEELIQNKITRLLQLPTIKRANSQAQKIKMLSMEQSNKKSFQKQQILKKFQHYFSKQVDLIHKKQNSHVQAVIVEPLLKKRAKTSVD